MAAMNLVSSFAGFFFLVIGTREVVQSISMCMKNMYMDKFLKISKKSMSMLMRVKRLDEGGIVLWASQSWLSQPFPQVTRGKPAQLIWRNIGNIFRFVLEMLSFRISIGSTGTWLNYIIYKLWYSVGNQKINPSIWQSKPNIQTNYFIFLK